MTTTYFIDKKINSREENLFEGYNKLEEMLKLSQLVTYVFDKSVLNEIRYFARAYVDIRLSKDEEAEQKAYGRAEAALSAAFTDILDALVNHIKVIVQEFRSRYIYADVWQHLDDLGYEYAVKALQKADEMILQTRGDRTCRFDKYVEFSRNSEYQTIVEFAFSLLELERLCEVDRARSPKKTDLERLKWVREALGNKSKRSDKCMFELYVQPKYEAKDKAVACSVGVEGLLRLKRPDGPVLAPDAFLEAALNGNQGHNIALWVLNEAVSILKEWQKDSPLPDKFDFSINLSPSLAGDESFNETFCRNVLENEVADHISIEITENWIIEAGEHKNISHCISALPEGTRIAIDDFGAGTTKLEYLAVIDGLTSIKIDKSLVDGLLTKNKKKATSLIRGIISLAQSNNLKVIAEGVEKQEQLDILIELGVDEIQGYLFSRPIPSDEFYDVDLAKR